MNQAADCILITKGDDTLLSSVFTGNSSVLVLLSNTSPLAGNKIILGKTGMINAGETEIPGSSVGELRLGSCFYVVDTEL